MTQAEPRFSLLGVDANAGNPPLQDSLPIAEAGLASRRTLVLLIGTPILLIVAVATSAFLYDCANLRALLPSDLQVEPPSPPKHWIPVSRFAIPVTPVTGSTFRTAAQNMNLESSNTTVEQGAAAMLWSIAEPAAVRVISTPDMHTGYFGGAVIVSPSGRALTALHVVDHAASFIFVSWDDGQVRRASMIAKDEAHDLALLQIYHEPSERFQFLRVADKNYAENNDIESGSFAMLMAFGKSKHELREVPVTLEGQKSSADLTWDSEQNQDDPQTVLYQLHGVSVQGDSGSPVLDERGTVIGITTGTNGEIFVAALPYKFTHLVL